jgi:hypothetical protein
MPTLVVPPRITPDTDAMLAAALAAGWDAERLVSWRVTAGLSQHDPVLYGEPLFADVVSGALGIALILAPFDWLPGLPKRYLQRPVALTSLGGARQHTRPAFIKPADDKCFPATQDLVRGRDFGATLFLIQLAGAPHDARAEASLDRGKRGLHALLPRSLLGPRQVP